jgi:hypothetical protein
MPDAAISTVSRNQLVTRPPFLDLLGEPLGYQTKNGFGKRNFDLGLKFRLEVQGQGQRWQQDRSRGSSLELPFECS